MMKLLIAVLSLPFLLTSIVGQDAKVDFPALKKMSIEELKHKD